MRRFHIVACAAAFVLLSCSACKKIPAGTESTSGQQPETGSQLADITYQVNVYSFADFDGDGWGDFRGIIEHLDYFKSLGVSALWLSPVQSAMSYHGYDVIDYSALNPRFGTEEDFQELIDRAGEQGIDIYMDYVLNHSGSGNPWFQQACADPGSKYRDYYVFSENPSADVAAGKVDNYAGAASPGMGAWYTLSDTAGRLHFKWDWNARTVTVTASEEAAQASNPSATKWLYYGDGKLAGLYETSSGIFEITVDFSSSWGFLLRTSTTSWDNGTKWGGNGTALTLGTPYTVNNSSAKDIPFSGGVSYFASFDSTMPDLNYGPYTTAASSAAFKDLAASADKWINMGVNGMRLDAVLWIYQKQVDANVAFLTAWYDHCNATYKARGGTGDFFMVGEAWTDTPPEMAPYFKALPSNFDFHFWWNLKDAINSGQGAYFADKVIYSRDLFKAQRAGFIDSIKLSNHDENRAAEDLGRSLEKEKLAAAVLLTSPGKPFIYQGEELGYWGKKDNGDEFIRTPIKWSRSGGIMLESLGGKVDKEMLSPEISVEAQTEDPASLLNVYRKFAGARNSYKALAGGEIASILSSNRAVALWTMSCDGQTVLVAHNFSGNVASITLSGYSVDNLLVSNGVVTGKGSSLTLGAYASAVFAQ